METSQMKILIADSAPIIILEKIKCLYLLGLPKLEIVFLDTVMEEISYLKVDPEAQLYDFLIDFNNRVSIYPTHTGMIMESSRMNNRGKDLRNIDDTERGIRDWLEKLDEGERLDCLSEYIVVADNRIISRSVEVYARELASKPLCLTTLSFIKSLQEAQLIESVDDILDKIKMLSKGDIIDDLFEQYSKVQRGQSEIIEKTGYKNLHEFITEYYRRGYPMPENPDKEENQRIIEEIGNIFMRK